MNRISSVLFVLLALAIWACGGTKSEKAPDMADAKEEVAETTSAAADAMTMSNDLYTLKVLKGDIPSPMKELTTKIGDADLKIVYGSPSVKGRTVWGDLVPYDEVWRTGANENTTFEVSKDIEISGQPLPAGKYGFFTVPGENDWTLVFNSVNSEWGAYNYDESKDVMRVKVVPQESDEMAETMDFAVTDENTVALMWDKLTVPFEISVK